MHPSDMSLSDFDTYCKTYDAYNNIKLESDIKKAYEEIDAIIAKDNLLLIQGGNNEKC